MFYLVIDDHWCGVLTRRVLERCEWKLRQHGGSGDTDESRKHFDVIN
jgi:hypothetical protein